MRLDGKLLSRGRSASAMPRSLKDADSPVYYEMTREFGSGLLRLVDGHAAALPRGWAVSLDNEHDKLECSNERRSA